MSSLSSSSLCSLSSSSSSSDDDDDCSLFDSISKREYLLAQIRQKDNIIESLLKQVRLPNILPPHPLTHPPSYTTLTSQPPSP